MITTTAPLRPGLSARNFALCGAVALGQISPATHAAKYASYSALVTSLGGVPRSDC